jgi:hypothetical protein
MDTTRRDWTHDDPSHSERHGTGSDTLKSVRGGLDSAANYVSDTVDSAQRRIVEFRDHGFDRVREDVVKYTREQPTNALLVAAGLGLLLGIFSGLRRR